MSRYVQGLDQMISYVRSLDREQEKTAKKAVRESAYLMEAQAKALAPVQTGYLRESIKTHIKEGGLTAEVISHAEYSLFVEYGTSKQEAQQFMSPAFLRAKEHFERSNGGNR
jgi:HK97 gp10 family phage protein